MKSLFLNILTLTYTFCSSYSKPLKSSNPIMPNHIDMDILLPYYGGLRGHYAQIKDGIVRKILKNPNITATTIETVHVTPAATTFEEDFMKIQIAAARLVAIQQKAKNKGAFSSEDNRVYAESLLELGKAAQNLALLQQTGQIEDFSILLQPNETAQNNFSSGPIAEVPEKSPSSFGITSTAPPVTTSTIIRKTTTNTLIELDLLPSVPKDPYEYDNDDVAIIPPKKDASIAEAKPIGISIAGEGGVASAKPNAIALSGRYGLAVASPKATAIAGVTAEEAAAFSISIPSRNHVVIKNSNKQQQQQQELQAQS